MKNTMPQCDKTGPQGQGPMTGRGMGVCGGGFGNGRGRCCRGYGRGLGRYFGWNVPQTKEEQIEDSQEYKKALQEEMDDVEKQLADLQKQD